jgi:hypothetical protein
MTEPAKKALPKVNLDEFERRLRATGPQTQTKEDPLAELARLIGMEDNVTPLFTPTDVKIKPAEARVAEAAHPLELPVRDRSAAPAAPAPAALAPAAPLAAPPAPVAPPTVEHHDYQPPIARDAVPAAEMAPEYYEDDDASDHPHEQPQVAMAEADEAPPRRRRSSLVPSILVIIGVAGLMGAWAYRGAPGLPKAPPLIMAADGPTKVQAPTPADSSAKSDNASILLKDAQQVSSSVKVVTSEEQPVDLQQQANVTPAPAVAAPSAPAADASAPAQAAPAPIAIAPAPPPSQLFPEPKRVKTVSVRPDGTLISADTAPSTAPMPNPVKSLSRPSIDPGAPAAAVQPATPRVDLPAHASKSTARVAIAKIDTTASPAADQAAPPSDTPAGAAQEKADKAAEKAQKATERAEKAKAAKAVKAQQAADAATAPAAAPAETKAAKPQQVADAAPVATAPTAGGGAYSVQLAAPPSEEEAQATASRLSAKYASELGGLQPTIHKAESKGRDIYRVRVGGLSKEDAHALCAKLEASGGKCFVAR